MATGPKDDDVPWGTVRLRVPAAAEGETPGDGGTDAPTDMHLPSPPLTRPLPEPKRVDLTGATVGDYQVVRLLAEGSAGEVYEAVHVSLGRKVALKVLKLDIADTREAARLLDEGRWTNAIGHPSIVDIFGFGKLPDGRSYLAMELLQGVDLQSHLRAHGAFTPAEVLELVRPVLAALGAAHQRGIIHRDVKAGNIFLAQTPRGPVVKLLDFGIARRGVPGQDVAQTRSDGFVGTPWTAAPEQLLGGRIGATADLYALGCVVWELLTAQPPFRGSSLESLVNAQVERAPDPPSRRVPSLSPAVDQAVLGLLAKNPAERPASAEAALALLERAFAPPATKPLWPWLLAGAVGAAVAWLLLR